LRQFGQ